MIRKLSSNVWARWEGGELSIEARSFSIGTSIDLGPKEAGLLKEFIKDIEDSQLTQEVQLANG